MRALGFDHVSDDDFARVTIAQSFAREMRFDPSGTSWLPFPFWMMGGAMRVFGRSLELAHGIAVTTASIAAALPYLAMRRTGASRSAGYLASLFAYVSPWSAWLGAATVPESMTASFTAASVIALGRPMPAPSHIAPISRWPDVAFALLLLAACLSRYEPWPMAATLAAVLFARAAKHRQAGSFVLVVILAAGPILWILWNASAHGDPLHFFARVAEFKRAIGEGTRSLFDAVVLYPRLLVMVRFDLFIGIGVALALTGTAAVATWAKTRWLVPLACVLAQIVFLAYGSTKDGAPAHHPERALLGTFFLLAFFAADLVASAACAYRRTTSSKIAGPLAAAVGLLAWILTARDTLRAVPGTGLADRDEQIRLGNRLRHEAPGGFSLTPCAFEHFALIAAYGAPERVEIRKAEPATKGDTCPRIDVRQPLDHSAHDARSR